MAPRLPVTCLWNLLGSGSLTTPAHPETPEAMVKQKQLLRSSEACLPEQNSQGKIPILHWWHTEAHPLMPTSVHQLKCFTKEPSAQPYHRGFTIGPSCCCWLWWTQSMCYPECWVPWLSLQTQVPAVCRANSICPQWCQNPLATSHSHPAGSPWLLPFTGYRWRTIDMPTTISMSITQMLSSLTHPVSLILHLLHQSAHLDYIQWNQHQQLQPVYQLVRQQPTQQELPLQLLQQIPKGNHHL